MALEPITRAEKIMSGESLEPITREEMFLAKLGGADVNTPTPITRKEWFLAKAIEGGSGGSGGSGTLICHEIEPTKETAFESLVDAEVCFPNADNVPYAGFMDCRLLRKIDLPIATEISDQAFQGCDSLTDVNVPAVLRIGMASFAKCTSLYRVDLPKATFVDSEAFAYCSNLSTIILRNSTTVCMLGGVNAIYGTKIIDAYGPTGEGFVYVPAAMFDAYRSVYEPAFEQAGVAGMFDLVFRKIEDYPEICG